jgi:hypothetical protein
VIRKGGTTRQRRTLAAVITFAKIGDGSMNEENPTQNSARVWITILTDLHFWVPAIVLFAGLAVLHWIR